MELKYTEKPKPELIPCSSCNQRGMVLWTPAGRWVYCVRCLGKGWIFK